MPTPCVACFTRGHPGDDVVRPEGAGAGAAAARVEPRHTWAQGDQGPAGCADAGRLRHGRCERRVLFKRMPADDPRDYYVPNLDATASSTQLVRLARSRWLIEQQYRELKDELDLDHFEGRTYPG